MKTYIIVSMLALSSLTTTAQTLITFDRNDYKGISIYDSWEESPYRNGKLQGKATVTTNPASSHDNDSPKVVEVERSRQGSNTFGVRIDLNQPLRMTKELQYIHIMTLVPSKPQPSRMMVIGLGKRLESDWDWQTGEDEQFWAITQEPIAASGNWQDIICSFKGFSTQGSPDNGIDIYALVLIPDVRSPHADKSDFKAYFDNILIDGNPDKRFTAENDTRKQTQEQSEWVSVNASQLNGDIVLDDAAHTPLMDYKTMRHTPLRVKIIPAKGFVQNGFELRCGEQVVKIPATAIAADGTYTIPAEYIQGDKVNIKGDMRQAPSN